MKQQEAINCLLETLIQLELMDASFLTGQIAKRNENEYSPIELHCIINKVNQVELRKSILPILETYFSVVYLKEERKPNLKFHVIYENGIELYLTCMAVSEIISYDDMLVLYDPKNLLHVNTQPKRQISYEDIGHRVDEFCLTLVHFYQAAKTSNLPKMCQLAEEVHQHFLYLWTYQIQISMEDENIMKHLTKEQKKKYLNLMRPYKIESLVEWVQIITNEIDEITQGFSIALISTYHLDFFLYSKKMIYSL